MVLFPPPFYFVFDISNLLSYIQNNFSYELARPIMGTIFLVSVLMTTKQIQVLEKSLVRTECCIIMQFHLDVVGVIHVKRQLEGFE